MSKPGKSKRGFAAMSPEKQREIASKGGKAAHEKGTAHEFTSEEARAAGKKGGDVVSRDGHHMSKIGALGGVAVSSGPEGAKHMARIGAAGGKANGRNRRAERKAKSNV